ncbi:MAG: hypothetical protein QG602_823, partial [Verrucomicrobiota bacterium]|nr:hypothetical protein [Verrucomicrobiota bacterium]
MSLPATKIASAVPAREIRSDAGSRSNPVWLQVAVAAAAIYVVCLLFGVLPRGTGPGFLGALNSLCAWAMWRASRRAELPAPVRGGLKLTAVGLTMLVLGTVYQNFLIHTGRDTTIFNFSDAFFLSVYPCFLGALYRLPTDARRITGWARIVVDGAVYLVGVGMPVWLFAIQPQLAQASLLDSILIIVWPLCALCGVFGINVALLTKAALPSRRAVWLLIGGMGVSWLADMIFSLDAAAQIIINSSINWINIANTVATVLLLIAARRFAVDPVPVQRHTAPTAFSPVPVFTILLVLSWLAFLSIRPDALPVAANRAFPALILLFIVLLGREVLVMRDSLRWMAAEAARESQARFESMVRNSSDLILVVGRNHRIQFASPCARRLLGQDPEELSGQSLPDLAHADETAVLTGFLQELSRHPGQTTRIIWRVRLRDGQNRYLETLGCNLFDESTIGGLVLNSRDVSERIALEESLQRTTKMDAIARLAGGMAHDFNNLLAVMLSSSELALLDLPPEHPMRANLDAIKSTAKRGADLTRRLLAISRSDHQQPRVVSPGEVLRSARPTLHRIITGNQVLHISVANDAGCACINPELLEQGFITLATNARDAMSKGGSLTMRVRAATVSEALVKTYLPVPPGRYVVIEASDTGVGMDEEARAKLFEPFFSTKNRGRGFGLASLYGMTKTARGGITVQTSPGCGTTISIWLPEVPPAPSPARLPRQSAVSGTATILLVDDEPLLLKTTHRILQAKGFTVMPAGSAEEAKEVLAMHSGPVHLLLTDVIMPGQSGPALATDLVKSRPELRVLYMSGYTGSELG